MQVIYIKISNITTPVLVENMKPKYLNYNLKV